jgi:hypothetical protein
MKPSLVLCMALLDLLGCGPYDNDSGTPVPASWWPWVCPDDDVRAPDAGCSRACPNGEAGADGDCIQSGK